MAKHVNDLIEDLGDATKALDNIVWDLIEQPIHGLSVSKILLAWSKAFRQWATVWDALPYKVLIGFHKDDVYLQEIEDLADEIDRLKVYDCKFTLDVKINTIIGHIFYAMRAYNTIRNHHMQTE